MLYIYISLSLPYRFFSSVNKGLDAFYTVKFVLIIQKCTKYCLWRGGTAPPGELTALSKIS